MRRRTRLAIACALAAAFILAGPYVTRADARPAHADTSTWSRATLRTAVRSLETRNARQARMIRALQRQTRALQHSTGLILVTLPELVGYSRNGIRIGLIYVSSLKD